MKIPKKSILDHLRGLKITPKSVSYGKYLEEVRGFILERTGHANAGADSEIFEKVDILNFFIITYILELGNIGLD